MALGATLLDQTHRCDVMFFPELIKSIKPSDRVLEIGPGGTPHPRADILLEYDFGSASAAEAQRGYAPPLRTSKPLVYFTGERFPFGNREFDYIICSHVIEHIKDVTAFTAELSRVGKAGYLEYPTIYYDYLYNFPEHLSFVKLKSGRIYWMNKNDSPLAYFQTVQSLFYESLRQQYYALVDDLKPYFFEGFEWDGAVEAVKTSRLDDLVFERVKLAPKRVIAPKPRFFLGERILSRFLSWSKR